MSESKLLLICGVFTLMASVLCAPLSAQSVRWDKPGGGLFDFAENWSPEQIPGPNDKVFYQVFPSAAYMVLFPNEVIENGSVLVRGDNQVTFLLEDGTYSLDSLRVDTATLTVKDGLLETGPERFDIFGDDSGEFGHTRGEFTLLSTDGSTAAATSSSARIGWGLHPGTATVSGDGAGWTIDGDLVFGAFGSSGDMFVEKKGTVQAGDVNIASDVGSDGQVWVRDSNSTFTVIREMLVGDQGDATLMIEGGGQATAGDQDNSVVGSIVIGAQSTGTGMVTVKDTGSKLNVLAVENTEFFFLEGSLSVGTEGRGTLNVEGGGEASAVFVGVGAAPLLSDSPGWGTVNIHSGGSVRSGKAEIGSGGGTGEVNVEGKDSTWEDSGLIIAGSFYPELGEQAHGTLNVRDGATAFSHGAILAFKQGDLATVNVVGDGTVPTQGEGSRWTVGASDLRIAVGGEGRLIVERGGVVSVTDGVVSVGRDETAKGHLTVKDPGSRLEILGGLSNGGRLFSGDGEVTVDIEAGGVVNVARFVGVDSSAGASVTVAGAGSKLHVTGDPPLGLDGNPIPSIIVGGQALVPGGNPIPHPGTLTVRDGGEVIAQTLEVRGNGVLTGAGGTVRADVTNAGGTVRPGFSPGVLVIDGDYTQEGTLEIEVGGAIPISQYDVLSVSGVATLKEQSLIDVLLIDLADLQGNTNPFSPELGDSFEVLRAGEIVDLGVRFNLPTLAVGRLFELVTVPLPGGREALRLTVAVPEPATLMLLAAGALTLLSPTRRRGRRPAGVPEHHTAAPE